MTNPVPANETECSTDGDSYQKFSSDLNLVVFLAVIGFLIIIFTLLFNIALIIALCLYRATCFHENKITRTMITSMAVIDVLISLIQAPPGVLLVITNGKWILGSTLLKLWEGFSIVLCALSASHIFGMALDKYLAVCQPTRYMVLPEKAGYIMVSLAWLVPVTLLSIMFSLQGQQFGMPECEPVFEIIKQFYQKSFKVIFYFVYFVIVTPILLTYVLYFFILVDIYRWSQRTGQIQRADKENRTPTSCRDSIVQETVLSLGETVALFKLSKHTNTGSKSTDDRKTLTHRWRRNLKAIRTIGWIVIAFTVCWFPSIITAVTVTQGHPMSMQSFIIVNWITYINSTLNPLLCYGVTFVRLALRKLFFH
ncbi:beta-3 adrenergic receptor [Biomphalaria glabrata]|nr:beta-3 adrenergic receptor [Biomphalaria glabrata]